MMAATAVPAARMVKTPARNRLILVRCAFAAPVPAEYCRADEQAARSNGPGVCVSIAISKNLRPSFARSRHLAGEGFQSLPGVPCEANQRCKLHDQGIAFVFQVEL